MTWLFFSFIAVAFAVIINLVSKKILSNESNYDPLLYASALFGTVSLYSFAYYLIQGVSIHDFSQLLSMQVLPVLALNIVCYTLAPIIYYRALKHLPVSEVTILYSLTGFYILLLGLLFGIEQFEIARIFGGVLIIGSVVALTIKNGKWKNSVHTKLMFLATFLYAIAGLTDKTIVSENMFNPVFFQAMSFGIPSLLLMAFNLKSLTQFKTIYNTSLYPKILLNGVFFFVNYFAIYKAYAYQAEASQVSFVIATETVIMVIIAAIFLKEREQLVLKVAAAIACMIGVYLLK